MLKKILSWFKQEQPFNAEAARLHNLRLLANHKADIEVKMIHVYPKLKVVEPAKPELPRQSMKDWKESMDRYFEIMSQRSA